MEPGHDWKLYDDIVAYYIYKFGTDNIGLSKEKICSILNIKNGSMKMKLDNIKALDRGGKLVNASKRCKITYEAFKNIEESYYRELVLKILDQ